jgi:hypothetical protein
LWNETDRAAIEAAVDDFLRKVVIPAVERPEAVLAPSLLEAIDDAGRNRGILPQPGEPGFALWDVGAPLDLSLSILRRTAQVSAGIAFRFHIGALGTLAAERLGLSTQNCLLSLYGAAPFGKGALANLLYDAPADEALLQESFPTPGREVLVHGPANWTSFVAPGWENGLVWRRWDRERVSTTPERYTHGLCEAELLSMVLSDEGEPVSSGEPFELFLKLSKFHALGCLAIALGAVENALAMATRYASQRRQGGTLIRDHAAIRLLLGEASASVRSVTAMLESAGRPRNAPDALEHALALRATAHPLLCNAANQCLQVFGGYGYMQDYGLEKIVRDCNALRTVGGVTSDLLLHLGAKAVLP